MKSAFSKYTIGLDVGPCKGQMIHGEVTNGGIKRVYVEKSMEPIKERYLGLHKD